MLNGEIRFCKLYVGNTGTGSFVNCTTWSPKDYSSEKSWYVISRSSLGNNDCPG